MMNWSAGLVSSHRQELADMVLRYTLPCEHLSKELKDAKMEAACQRAVCIPVLQVSSFVCHTVVTSHTLPGRKHCNV